MSEAAEVHQEFRHPEVPTDPGGAPEALLAPGAVPRQTKQRGRLSPLRPRPVRLLGGTGTLQVRASNR